MLKDLLLAAALALPKPYYAPDSKAAGALETDAAYEARVEVIAEGVANATLWEREGWDGKPRYFTAFKFPWGRQVLAAMVLTHWYEESRFALEVHAGAEHPVWTQDVGKARCLGQHHRNWMSVDAWRELAGTDTAATERCATATARMLAHAARMCGQRDNDMNPDGLLAVFSAMGGGGCEPTAPGRRKVARFAKVWRAMQQARR